MRPTHDEYFLAIAKAVAARSTCRRRAVGCVLVDERHHILATGYNGVASGMPHCNEEAMMVNLMTMHKFKGYPHTCSGASALSGTDLDKCQAIHAEQNALVQCRDAYQIESVYCTVEPCISCTKLLLGTSAQRVVFADLYRGSGRELWASSRDGHSWAQARS